MLGISGKQPGSALKALWEVWAFLWRLPGPGSHKAAVQNPGFAQSLIERHPCSCEELPTLY